MRADKKMILWMVLMVLVGLRMRHLHPIHRILHIHIATFLFPPIKSLNGSSDIDLFALWNLILFEHFPACPAYYLMVI
jgi:hypothetical protein